MIPRGMFLTEIVGFYLPSDLMISETNKRNPTLYWTPYCILNSSELKRLDLRFEMSI